MNIFSLEIYSVGWKISRRHNFWEYQHLTHVAFSACSGPKIYNLCVPGHGFGPCNYSAIFLPKVGYREEERQRQTDRETDRQRDRKTARQKDSETDREIERQVKRDSVNDFKINLVTL